MVLYLHGEQSNSLNNKGDNNMKTIKTIFIQDITELRYDCSAQIDQIIDDLALGRFTLSYGKRFDEIHFKLTLEFLGVINEETGKLDNVEYINCLHMAELELNNERITFVDRTNNKIVEDITDYEEILIKTVRGSKWYEAISELNV